MTTDICALFELSDSTASNHGSFNKCLAFNVPSLDTVYAYCWLWNYLTSADWYAVNLHLSIHIIKTSIRTVLKASSTQLLSKCNVHVEKNIQDMTSIPMSTNPNKSWSRKPEMKLTPKRRLAKLISAKALSFFWISPSLLFPALFLDVMF